MRRRPIELPRAVAASEAKRRALDLRIAAVQTADELTRRQLRLAAGRWEDRAIMRATLGEKEARA